MLIILKSTASVFTVLVFLLFGNVIGAEPGQSLIAGVLFLIFIQLMQIELKA